MPFPLAHPAAVLPLRRLCPRWLNFPALIIGSLSPDAAYLFGKLDLDQVSHRSWGILAFCLPVSGLLVALLYAFRARFSSILPEGYRRALLPQTWQPMRSVLPIALSIVIGAATHLLWDSFTHPHGWAVEQWPVLATALGSFSGHTVRLCRILWYVSSFAGAACVYLAYRKAQPRPASYEVGNTAERPWLEAVVIAALVLPIELVHDLLRNPTGGLIVALLSAALVTGVLWQTQARASRSRAAPRLNG